MEARTTLHDLARAGLEGVVDLASKLVPYDEEDDERRDHDRERDRRRGDESEAGPEAHGSRSA